MEIWVLLNLFIMNPKKPLKSAPIWRKSLDLAIAVNHVIRNFPEQEKQYQGLKNQLMQAAISIPARIAESQFPLSEEQMHAMKNARFNITELDFLLDVSLYLGYLDETERKRLYENCEELRGLINRLLKSDFQLIN